MGRELRWHLARPGREKLKGLGKPAPLPPTEETPAHLSPSLAEGTRSAPKRRNFFRCCQLVGPQSESGWVNWPVSTGFKFK
jgi:hypothetical protein